MTSALLIPVILACMFLLEHWIFRKFWSRGLRVKLEFGARPVSEGEMTTLTETVTNRNFLPLPVVTISFQTNNGLAFPGEKNMTVSDHTNMWDIFSIRFYEKITRTLPLLCLKRGYYRINRTSVTAQDALTAETEYINFEQDTHLYVFPSRLEEEKMAVPLEKILGEVQARRHLFEDVFMFRGIRGYERTDPMNTINWKATARTGDLKVNLHDSTAGQSVRILLNLEDPAIYYHKTLLEDCIRIAAAIATRLIGQSLPVSIITNGRDAVTRQTLELPVGASPDHEKSILELLARIDLAQPRDNFMEVLDREIVHAAETDLTYVLISSNSYGEFPDRVEAFGRVCGRLLWLCPVTKDMADPYVGPHVEYLRLRH